MSEVQTEAKKIGEEQEEFTRVYESQEALSEALANNSALGNDFLVNGDKYQISPKVDDSKDESPQESNPEESEAKKMEKVTLEVSQDDLGTYGKNRTTDEAIIEALKGNKEKDKTIEFLKDNKLPMLEKDLETSRSSELNLKKQLAEFEQMKKDGKIKSVEKPVLTDLPDLKDEEDFYDEANQKKIKDAIASQADVKAYIEKLEGQVANQSSSPASTNDNAFEEVDTFMQSTLGSTRKFKDMQDDYLHFMDNLRIVAGVNAPLMDESGGFSPEIQGLYQTFHSEGEAGDQLRAKAQGKAVKPADFSVLSKVYDIQALRNNHFERDTEGIPVPISYEKALRLYEMNNPPVVEEKKAVPQESSPSTSLTDIERKAKAAENVANSSREVPVGTGGDVDIDNYPTDKFFAQMEKPVGKWTDHEVELFKRVAKSKGMTEDFVKYKLGSKF